MARMSVHEDAHDKLYYVVTRNNGEERKEFYSHSEAEVYKNYLQSIEDREKLLLQNEQIIANQKRSLEVQERGSQMPIKSPIPPYSRQILDPKYKEWLDFQRETDPKFLKWKREKEEKEAKRKADYEAELERKRKEEEEKKRRMQKMEEIRRREVYLKRLESIKPDEIKILNGEEIKPQVRNYVAQYTENQQVIACLREIDNEHTLQILIGNNALNPEDLEYIKKKRNEIIKKRLEKSKTTRLKREQEARLAKVQSNNSGCVSILLLLIIPTYIISLLLIWG